LEQDYTKVFQDAEAVEKYETITYAPDSYASRINERQRAYLRGLVQREFGGRAPVQHDFACGTGRAIRTLHGMVRAAHGYDTSAEMMAKAAEVGSQAYWHQVPTDGPVPSPVPAGHPAIVTMFRLMLNVDDAVRDRAMAFAANASARSRIASSTLSSSRNIVTIAGVPASTGDGTGPSIGTWCQHACEPTSRALAIISAEVS